MPAEWEPHERTWMAWPSAHYVIGDVGSADAHEAREAWANVANAIVEFEPLTMVVDPSAVGIAREYLDPRVTLVEAPLDDAWMRDIGPTFVRTDDGLAGVDWVFNGWGAQHWVEWEKDALIARTVNEHAQVPSLASPMVNEGGGIHVDGRGTVLVTRTVQLGEGRNPTWTQGQVEAELARTLGIQRVIWLERGLTRDYEDYGTRGHVDIVACFTPDGRVLLHDQRSPEHPDHAVTAEVRAVLEAHGLTVIDVPAPATLRDEAGWVDWSYINHYVCNGAVILCAFDDPGDEQARTILAEAYPGREVVLVDARPIFARGGGIHCITQQQPHG